MAIVSEALTSWRKKGGGPKTAAGKKRSAQNSMRHGCRSQEKILPGESAAEYERLWAMWLDLYNPETELQLDLMGDVVDAKWRLKRAERSVLDAEQALAEAAAGAKGGWSGELAHRLQLMQRYRTTAENSFHKAVKLVEFLKSKQIMAHNELRREEPKLAQAVEQRANKVEGLVSERKKEKAQAVATPKTRAQELFQGQNNPKKQKKIVRLEQWVEVRVIDGKTVTSLHPSNEGVIARGKRMLPAPEYVYRRLNFPDGIPAEYEWCGVQDEEHRARGGCGTQRMTVDTWLDVIEREKLRTDGHVGPTGVGNLPRPEAHGECSCAVCSLNREIEQRKQAEAEVIAAERADRERRRAEEQEKLAS